MSDEQGRDIHSSQEEESYYAILGLEEDASAEQVRLAYRDLVRQYHPDAGLVSGTSLLFRRIQLAYETLRDPETRSRYDEELRRQGKRPPLLLDLDILLGPAQLMALEEPQLLYVLLKVTPISLQPATRTPLNVCLVLDRSTSMKGERLNAVREATLSLVEQLEPEDIFSLVVFSDRAEVLAPAQTQTDRRALRSVLGTLRPGGGTEIYQGVRAGLAELRRVRSDRHINHLILLTDGHTYGDAEKCLLAARQASAQHIGLSGIGVGDDWNEDFLDNLASAGGGTVMYIDRTTRIGGAFERRLRDLKDAWIPDISLRLHYDPIARHKDAFCLTPELRRLPGTADALSLGALQRTDARMVLLECIVNPQPAGSHRLLQVEIAGQVPAHGVSVSLQRAVRADFLAPAQTRPLVPQAVLEAAQRVSLLRMQERAYHEVQRGQIGPAVSRLEQIATQLLHAGYRDLAETFREEAQRLGVTGVISSAGTKRMRYGTRTLPMPAGRMP